MNSLSNLAARARSLFVSATGFEEEKHPRIPVGQEHAGEFSKGLRYHSEIGSFRGAVKIGGKWVSVKNLNHIEKPGWIRWQGPASDAIQNAMKEAPQDAKELFKYNITQQQKPINQTDTPEFKSWFGASKIVDKGGKPLVVYHGGASDFSGFDLEKTGQVGFYFSSDPKDAEFYADIHARWKDERGDNIMPVYLSIKNPAPIEIYRRESDKSKGGNPRKQTREALMKLGYDGAIFRENKDDTGKIAMAIAYSPNQIKSAIGNRGTWSKTNPDITASLATRAFNILKCQNSDNLILASDQTGHPFHGNQWTDAVTGQKLEGFKPWTLKISNSDSQKTGVAQFDFDRASFAKHPGNHRLFLVSHRSYALTMKNAALMESIRKNPLATEHVADGVKVLAFRDKEKAIEAAKEIHGEAKITASEPRLSNLAIRAAQVLSKGSQPSEPPASHRKARDAAQAIYEAAAIAAATKAQHEKDKTKRDEMIAAILLLLLMAGEDAYQKTYSVLDAAESRSTDEIQIGEQAKTFAADRQPDLKDFAGKLHDAIADARASAEADGLSEADTARQVRDAAVKKSGTMIDVETTCTLGSIELDRLKRAGFKTCFWSQLDRPTKRHSHTDNENEGIVKIGHRFSSGQRYPGDPCMGVGELAGCLCQLIPVGRE